MHCIVRDVAFVVEQISRMTDIRSRDLFNDKPTSLQSLNEELFRLKKHLKRGPAAKKGVAMHRKETGSISEDFGKLILRATLAILILFHGVSKVIHGPAFVTDAVARMGLQPALGYLVYIGEVIAPLLVLLGIWTRVGAVVIAINMVVAIILVHTSQLWMLSRTGGWALELQGMYLVAALAVALLGAGRYGIAAAGGKAN